MMNRQQIITKALEDIEIHNEVMEIFTTYMVDTYYAKRKSNFYSLQQQESGISYEEYL